MSSKLSWRRVFLFSGAFVAFLVGSGFSTGQEVLQYFAGYGYMGILGTFIVFALLAYAATQFLTLGHHKQFKQSKEVYIYYCGKYIGGLYDYFSLLVVYSSFIVMVAGAGAALQQHYGFDIYVGGILLGLCSTLTVCLGLKNIISILGKIGPILIFFLFILGIISFYQGEHSLLEAHKLIPEIEILHAGHNWFIASTSYVGMCMLWLAVFLTALGKDANSNREAYYGGILGAFFFFLAILLLTLSLVSNITIVSNSMIPTLLLAKNVHPLLGSFFALLILIGIYTASVPLLWTVCSRFTVDSSKKFKLVACVLASIGVWIGLLVPFNTLVNKVYVVNGYVGTGLLIFMIGKNIALRWKK